MTRWRWIDTGILPAAENMALNRALLEARQAGEAPSTLRFVRFSPSALLGRHGDPRKELDLEYCRSHGVAVQRRMTGGGAIYMDEGMLGWELYLERAEAGAAEMAAISRRMCEAAIGALASLGVTARYRAPTEILVRDRKICGTGGAIDDHALIYQGSLLIDFDPMKMLRVLGVREERALAATRASLVTLSEVLEPLPPLDTVRAAFIDSFGAEFDVRIEPGELNEAEKRRRDAAHAGIDTPQWVGL